MKAMLIASLLISAPEDLPGHREGHPKRVAKTLEHGDPLPCCAQTRDATAARSPSREGSEFGDSSCRLRAGAAHQRAPDRQCDERDHQPLE